MKTEKSREIREDYLGVYLKNLSFDEIVGVYNERRRGKEPYESPLDHSIFCDALVDKDAERAWAEGYIRDTIKYLEEFWRHLSRKQGRDLTPETMASLGKFYLINGRYAKNEKDIKTGRYYAEKALVEISKPEYEFWKKRGVYGHIGQALSRFSPKSLEDIVMVINAYELSDHYGNKEKMNKQLTGTAYYDLYIAVKNDAQIDRLAMCVDNLTRVTGSKKIGKLPILLSIVIVDSELRKSGEYYNLKERAILNYALYHLKKADQEDPYNKSYRGNCQLALLKLDRLKLSENIILKRLHGAEELFRDSILGKDRLNKVEPSDYSLLAETFDRIADVEEDLETKIRYLMGSIESNKKAIKLAIEKEQDLKSEWFSFLGYSLIKLSRYIEEPEEKVRLLFRGASKLKGAVKLGDNSPEIKSKIGEAYLNILNLESRHLKKPNVLGALVEKAKDFLAEAGENVKVSYPLFLLYSLSEVVSDYGLDGVDIMEPKHYLEGALYTYTKERDNWKNQRMRGCYNEVLVPLDEYGLLSKIFLLKKGKAEYLDKERKNVDSVREELEKEFGSPKKRMFNVPKSFSIVTLPLPGTDVESKFYVIGKSGGDELGKFLIGKKDSEKIETLERVVEFLAFIHAKLSPGENKFETDWFITKKISDLFKEKDLEERTKEAIQNQIIDKLTENYDPIRKEIKEHDVFYVFNKDAHPRNWLVDKSKKTPGITAIDFEAKHTSIPAEVDLVRLMEPIELSYERKEDIFNHYVTALEKFTGESLSKRVLMRRYLNLSLPQIMAFLTWEHFSKEAKEFLIRSCRENLRRVTVVDPEYHEAYKKNYEALDKVLEGLDVILG